MPQTKLIMFKDDDNTCPLLQWILSLEKKAKDKCFVKIKRLAELGHELRRPEADFLRDGIYELRTHKGMFSTGCYISFMGIRLLW